MLGHSEVERYDVVWKTREDLQAFPEETLISATLTESHAQLSLLVGMFPSLMSMNNH